MSRRAAKEARLLVTDMAEAIKSAMVDAILEVRALDAEIDDVLDESVNGLTAEVEVLQGQLDAAKVEAEGLQSDLDEAQARIGELETELDQVAADRRDIKGQLDAEKLKVQTADAERDQWKGLAERYKFDLDGKTAEMARLQSRFDTLGREKKRLQEDFDRKVKECDAMRPAGAANSAALAEIQSKYDELKSQYDRAVADYHAIAGQAGPSEEVAALNGEVASLKAKLAGALQQLTAQAEAKVVMTGAFQDQLKVNQRLSTPRAGPVSSALFDEAAETIALLVEQGLNDQQIAARFNHGRPMAQQINGAAVKIIRGLVRGLAA